jgi:gas vesicle protein
MENKKIVKQMIDLHKTSFEKSFSTMAMHQNQTEKLLKTFVDQTPGISDEGKKVIDQWSDAYKKWIDDVKKVIDEGYAKVGAFLENNTIFMFQNQTDKMFNPFLNQKNWMPQDLKENMEELTDNYKSDCDKFPVRISDVWKTFPLLKNRR